MRYLTIFTLSFLFVLGCATSSFAQKAFLGVYTNSVSKEKAKKLQFDNPYGTYISSVLPNTAAAKSGLRAFDYLIGMNQTTFSRSMSFTEALRRHKSGDKVKLRFIRRGKEYQKEVTLGSKGDSGYAQRSKSEDPFFGVNQYCSKSGNNTEGVSVTIVKNSSAATLGLEDGDFITRINDYPIYDWQDISAGIDMLEVGETIRVQYIRDGATRNGQTNIRSYADSKNTDCCDHLTKNNYTSNYNDNNGTSNTSNRAVNFELEKRDVQGMAIDMEEVGPNDAADMKNKYDIDMPLNNDLAINNVQLFPNPSMGMFELNFDLASKGDTKITIYNGVGRKIYNYDLGDFSGTFKDAIDISQNGTGLYFLEILQEGKSVVKKIVLKAS